MNVLDELNNVVDRVTSTLEESGVIVKRLEEELANVSVEASFEFRTDRRMWFGKHIFYVEDTRYHLRRRYADLSTNDKLLFLKKLPRLLREVKEKLDYLLERNHGV